MPTPAASVDSSRFYLLRHGQSEANVKKLIASSLAAAGEAYGLTDAGCSQVLVSVIAARADGTLPTSCGVVSSPLLRARETAVIAAEALGTTVRVDARLAERGFGEFELGPDEHYERIWAEDRANPAHERWGVESVTSILRRVTTLLHELQSSDAAAAFLLCTHGDVASVLLCATQGLPLAKHRDVGAMANGEVRRIGPALSGGLSGLLKE